MRHEPPLLDDDSGLLQPPRFGLKTLLALVAALCLFFGLAASLGVVWAALLALFALLIAAHVLGNALGTKLRDGGENAARDEPPPDPLPRSSVPPLETRLQQKVPLGRGMLIFALASGIPCGLIGAFLAALIYGEGLTPAGALLAALSAAVIGAIASFALSNFCRIMLTAWREAVREMRRSEPS